MTCTYEREQLALYVNGDASAEERERTRDHLAKCVACREIVSQYRMLAAETAQTLMDINPPHRPAEPRPAARRWRMATVTVAVAASLALALLISTRVPAVAAMVDKIFPWLTVSEMDQQETAAYLQEISQPPATITPMDAHETASKAGAALGQRIPEPTALPPGMALAAVNSSNWESGHTALLTYHDPGAGWHLYVRVTNLPEERSFPEGATSHVTVNGAPAVAIHGIWYRPSADKPVEWQPDGGIEVIFQLDDLHVHVSAVGQPPSFTVDDLIKIAESIR